MIKYTGVAIFALAFAAFVARGVFALIKPITTASEPILLLLLGIGLLALGIVARKKLRLT